MQKKAQSNGDTVIKQFTLDFAVQNGKYRIQQIINKHYLFAILRTC
jgi:hypothetical protein